MFERKLERYKKKFLDEYKQTGKSPLSQKNDKFRSYLRKNGWTWNNFLNICGLPLNMERGIWLGQEGLEKAKNIALNYYKKNQKSPRAHDFFKIRHALDRGCWEKWIIGKKWNDFLLYCKLPITHINTIYKNETEAVVHRFFNSCRQGTIKRGISFELTFDFLVKSNILFQPCISCGVVGFSKSRHQVPIHYNGLDRIDSRKGYEFDNVQPMCGECNRIKWNYTDEQLSDEIGKKMIALIKYAKRKVKESD